MLTTGNGTARPDPEVLEKARRRRFTAEYKARVPPSSPFGRSPNKGKTDAAQRRRRPWEVPEEGVGAGREHAEFVGSLVLPEGDRRRPTSWQRIPREWWPW